MRDTFNIIPVSLALVLHTAIVSSMIVVFDFSGNRYPAVPLAVTARIVSEEALRPPPVEPEPDNAELERLAAEEAKRQEDLRIEQERIRREDEAERQRQQQAADERRQREDAELERRRAEAERRRQEEIERQRAENERLRKEAEEAQRRERFEQEIRDEEERMAARNAGLEEQYAHAIRVQIYRNWAPPASAKSGVECEVEVRQVPGGEVVGVRFVTCGDDDALRRSIEAAIDKASPLPDPPEASLFERNLRLILKTEQ